MAPHENVIQRLNELARRVDRLEGRVMVDALTKHDLQQFEDRIMSKISEFATAVEQYHQDVTTSLDALTADIGELNKTIAMLQSTPDAITPADQALLDKIQEQGRQLAAHAKRADDLTPPPVPQS